MVKVLPPRGGFARCVDTAVMGIALADTDWDDDRNEIHPRHRGERASQGTEDVDADTITFVDSPMHVFDLKLRRLQRHFQRHIELTQMELFVHKMQLRQANERSETLRLYDQATVPAIDRSRLDHA